GFKFNNDDISIDMIYRKSVIRKLNYVLTSKTGDFNILKNNFSTDARRYDLIHPLPLDFDNLNKSKRVLPEKFQLKNRFKRVILVGNSANSSNNHIEILYNFKRIDSNNFCIVMPLSYSGHDRYINELIKVGKKLFGERFIPIREYLDKEVYSQLLNQVDVAIFNHKRQQALANIIALLYLGKKVYIRKDISSFDFLDNKGLKVFEIDNLKSDIIDNKLYEIDKRTIKNNRDNIIKYFNNNSRIKYMKRIFNKKNEFKIIVLGNQKSGTSAIAHLLAEYGQLSKTIDIPNLLNNNRLRHKVLESKYFANTLIKEPTLTFFYEDVLKKYPMANYIFIVRHPLDNIRSILDRINVPPSKLPLNKKYIEKKNIKKAWKRITLDKITNHEYDEVSNILAHRWKRAASDYLQNKNKFILVKYEDFIRNKSRYIKKIANKIGIQQKADISNIVDIQFQPKGSNKQKDISKLFGEKIIRNVENICKEEMIKLDYNFYSENRK
ncbi:MAG: TDP-N-acetylfucosamine:lipid II N-acetylfucosaminyltransferase, partial [bacterium]